MILWISNSDYKEDYFCKDAFRGLEEMGESYFFFFFYRDLALNYEVTSTDNKIAF